MTAYVLWYFFIGAGFLACIVTLALMWFRFPERTVDDVVDYLLPVDLDKVEELLDPQTEAILRNQLTSEEFRRLQRKRIHQYVAFLQRMSHNAAILVEWANREADGSDERKKELAAKMQQLGVEVRLYSLVALVKLRFWLLIRLDSWRILPAPCLHEVREAAGVKGMESYDKLKTAASFLFLEMGQQNYEQLMHNL